MSLQRSLQFSLMIIAIFCIVGVILGYHRRVPQPYVSISKFNRMYRSQILEMIAQDSEFDLNLPNSNPSGFHLNTNRKIIMNSDHLFSIEENNEHKLNDQKNKPRQPIPQEVSQNKKFIPQLEGKILPNHLFEMQS